MTRMTHALAAFATTALLVGGASSANARGEYVSELPNAPNGCNTCHTNGGGSPRNDFGLDAEDNIVGGAVDWSALFSLDSDGDGQTNGQELGDPCGTWTDGDAPRTTDLSDPADSGDTSADPDTPSCDGGEPEGTPEGEPEGGADAGCGGANATNDGPPAALAVLGVAIAMVLRRRRRR